MPITDRFLDSGWFDSHCHLNDIEQFPEKWAQANQNLIFNCVVPGTAPEQWQQVITSLQPGCFAAIGIHPWFVNNPENQLVQLREAISQHSIVAIGEIGLDFFFGRNPRPDRDLQIETFEQQLILAQQHNLPVIIHSVKAHQDILRLLKNSSVTGVIHAFNSSLEIATQYLDAGFFLGIGPQLKKSKKLQRVLQALPLDRLLLETDAPFMTTTEIQNPLLELVDVGMVIADLMHLDAEVVKQNTTANTKRLFGR